MSFGRLLRSVYLLYFSQPAADRAIFKALKKRPIRSIVELGIGFSGRTRLLFEVAAWQAENLPLRYTGIDLFEARPAGQPRMPLKRAFAEFRQENVRIQLVPGEPGAALRRVANSLTGTDLLLISADQDADSLASAWTWMPRMLTADSLIFREEPAGQPGKALWRPVSLAEIQSLAAQSGRARRRAA